jgi:thymidylate synthase
MHVSKIRNVCQALPASLQHLDTYGEKNESRAGPVLVVPWPVMTATSQPRERVLFSSVRDANPFFHLVEAIWMLAGRNDAATLNCYVRDFGERFAEPDGRIHDAYGRRWRKSFGYDQLDLVVRRLIENPADRQAVIQMWDPSPVGDDDLRGDGRGRPCNTSIYLRVRAERGQYEHDQVLDLTVCCRSNDMVWGAHGANAVHFSILQEYLAARIDVGIGVLYQLSNNAHVYIAELDRLNKKFRESFQKDRLLSLLYDDRYSAGEAVTLAMFIDPGKIDQDVQEFMRWHDTNGWEAYPNYYNSWFELTLGRAVTAHRVYRRGDLESAIEVAEKIEAPDWRIACVEWLQRRMK